MARDHKIFFRVLAAASVLVLAVSACGQVMPISLGSMPTLRADVVPRENSRPALAEATPMTLPPNLLTEPVMTAQPTAGVPTQVSTATSAAKRPTVRVHRGAISEEVLMNGRVAGHDEIPLTFPLGGRIKSIFVRAGQHVEKGQVLVELDSADLAQEINAQQQKVELAGLQVDQARQQAATATEIAIEDAAGRLRSAQAELQALQAGPSPADRKAAESAVASATANLLHAEAELAHLQAAPSPNALQEAQQRVADAELAVRTAEAEQATLAKGPNPDVVRGAERELASARAAFDTAQADLNRLTKGPDALEVRSAQRGIEQAQAALNTADSGASKLVGAAKEAAVSAARLNLDDARDKLARLQQPPAPELVSAAKNKAEEARLTVEAADAKLQEVRKGPDNLAIDTAAAKVESQRAAVASAETALSTLKAGPSTDDVQAATLSVQSARLALEVAQARLEVLTSPPTQSALDESQARVNAAAAALASAQSGSVSIGGGAAPGGSGSNLAVSQRSLNQEVGRLTKLQSDLDATRLKAPTSGVVAYLQNQLGDSVDAGKVVLIEASPGDPLIRAVLSTTGSSVPRVQGGQRATIQLDGEESTPLTASVSGIEDDPNGPGQVAYFTVEWGSKLPVYGTNALVRVSVQEHTDALLVPALAVHTTAGRSSVQVLDGDLARVVEVSVGIANGQDQEILSGLQEGQDVLLSL